MAVGYVSVGKTAPFRPRWSVCRRPTVDSELISSVIRASQSTDDKSKVYKELGLFSLKKKIEDAVVRAEMMTPRALELEEAKRIKQEQVIREHSLWDDIAKSSEVLTALADTNEVVDALKDMRYKAEEAKLITQLADMDVINYQLFKQAYNASLLVSKFLDHYEMSKLLSGPYDMEGACVIIRAGSQGTNPEIWAERLLSMYMRWAEKHGCEGRVIEKYPTKYGGIKSATIEFESKYIYGYLCGERGSHQMIRSSLDGFTPHETSLAWVDVIPLFLDSAPDLHIDDGDLEISSFSPSGEEHLGYRTESSVSVCHIPTGINVRHSGERSHFANKMKALNRLKAKLLVIAKEQDVSDVKNIRRASAAATWLQETRRYFCHPYKLVQDVKNGVQLPDLNSILDGNLEPLIGAHISSRQSREADVY